MPNYILSIPEPCGQNWNNMTPNKNGRHCLECNKVVVDLTQMTNEEIVSYLLKNEGACGRIKAKSLEVPIQLKAPMRNIQYKWPAIAAMIVTGMFMVSPIYAQNTPHKIYDRSMAIPKYPTVKQNQSEELHTVVSANQLLSNKESHFTITGRVTIKGSGPGIDDDTSKATGARFAKLVFMREEREIITVKTDESGYFTFTLDNKYRNKWLNCMITADDAEEKIQYFHFTKVNDPSVLLAIELERAEYILGSFIVIQKQPAIMPGSIGSRIDLDYLSDFYFGR